MRWTLALLTSVLLSSAAAAQSMEHLSTAPGAVPASQALEKGPSARDRSDKLHTTSALRMKPRTPRADASIEFNRSRQARRDIGRFWPPVF
ncbi:MAG: hypothetical protein AB7E81_22800 [Hyphomicrobiaceae bacterium]